MKNFYKKIKVGTDVSINGHWYQVIGISNDKKLIKVNELLGSFKLDHIDKFRNKKVKYYIFRQNNEFFVYRGSFSGAKKMANMYDGSSIFDALKDIETRRIVCGELRKAIHLKILSKKIDGKWIDVM